MIANTSQRFALKSVPTKPDPRGSHGRQIMVTRDRCDSGDDPALLAIGRRMRRPQVPELIPELFDRPRFFPQLFLIGVHDHPAIIVEGRKWIT